MKKLTKLALVSSMAISANAMAMQAMDDAALSATTGQDGINIGIGISKIEIGKIFIHDNDGYSKKGNGTTEIATGKAGFGGTEVAGAISIKGNGTAGHVNETAGIVITANTDQPDTTKAGATLLKSHNLADIRIDSDAGTGTKGAFLNIAADVSGLNISIGEVGVTASGSATPTVGIQRGGVDANYNKILSGLSIKTGVMTANVQLGATPQGAMIKLNTTMTGGLTISDLGVVDAAGGGELWLGKIQVADGASTNLAVDADVSVTTNGLKILARQGDAGIDTYVQAIALGAKPTAALGARGTATAGSIGDVEIQGLKTFYSPTAGTFANGSVITISGR
ncbi:pilus assembly protein FilA [Acinetobacter chinensis]|jgi:hypothetical protein|uniref:Pilus assembly protein FilA n=1 Tax=Acinetobacter chinensis TaxID=2004650 RepID=A0ABU3WC08_9GAMM|nr:DUF6160 family protein [Acinetobacter chinensis]MDV2467382.1 pilus assembly protein FilA [Acinetobacter chinensis]WOE41024.1 pilus assembly protein FilA [Acinetobacter chinensis]